MVVTNNLGAGNYFAGGAGVSPSYTKEEGWVIKWLKTCMTSR